MCHHILFKGSIQKVDFQSVVGWLQGRRTQRQGVTVDLGSNTHVCPVTSGHNQFRSINQLKKIHIKQNLIKKQTMNEYKHQIITDIPSWHSFPIIRNTEKLCKIISSTNQRQLDKKMINEKSFETLPLAFQAFWFIL